VGPRVVVVDDVVVEEVVVELDVVVEKVGLVVVEREVGVRPSP